MWASLGPIEARPCEAPVQTAQLGYVDVPAREQFLAAFGDQVGATIDSGQESTAFEGFGEPHRYLTRQVIVAGACIRELILVRSCLRLVPGGDYAESFYRMCHFRRRHTVIPATALLRNIHQTSVKELAQVHTGRLRRYICNARQFTRRQWAAIEQSDQHCGPGRICDESRGCRNRKFPVHRLKIAPGEHSTFQRNMKYCQTWRRRPAGFVVCESTVLADLWRTRKAHRRPWAVPARCAAIREQSPAGNGGRK